MATPTEIDTENATDDDDIDEEDLDLYDPTDGVELPGDPNYGSISVSDPGAGQPQSTSPYGQNPVNDIGTTFLWDDTYTYQPEDFVIFDGQTFQSEGVSVPGNQPYIGSPDWAYIPGGSGDTDVIGPGNENCNNPPGAPEKCTPAGLEYVQVEWPSGTYWEFQAIE